MMSTWFHWRSLSRSPGISVGNTPEDSEATLSGDLGRSEPGDAEVLLYGDIWLETGLESSKLLARVEDFICFGNLRNRSKYWRLMIRMRM